MDLVADIVVCSVWRRVECRAWLTICLEAKRQRSHGVTAAQPSRFRQKMPAQPEDIVEGKGAEGAAARDASVLVGPRLDPQATP